MVINCKWCSFETAFSTGTASFEAIEIQHEKKGFVILTKSFVKIGITKIFSSINKTFGCCSKIFGCSNKKFI